MRDSQLLFSSAPLFRKKSAKACVYLIVKPLDKFTLLLILLRCDTMSYSVLLEFFARCTQKCKQIYSLLIFPWVLFHEETSLRLSPICKQRRNFEVISFSRIHYSRRFKSFSYVNYYYFMTLVSKWLFFYQHLKEFFSESLKF